MHKRRGNFSQDQGLKNLEFCANFHVKNLIFVIFFFQVGKIVVLIGIDFAGVKSM